MKITVVHESENYAIIEPPPGPIVTAAELLPILETLRAENGLRLCFIKESDRLGFTLLVCEKINSAGR